MSPRLKNSCAGFSLLEVLLALAIMAVLSTSGYLILDGVLRAQTQQREHLDNLRHLQRAVMVLDKDFQHIAPRTVRDGVGQSPMFSLSPNDIASDAGRVRFVRAGWHNPQGQFNRANLERVAYALQSNTLVRLSWTHLDTNRQQPPNSSLELLTQVKDFRLEVFNYGRWQTHWTSAETLPQAVRLTIIFTDGKILQRSYRLHAGRAR